MQNPFERYRKLNKISNIHNKEGERKSMEIYKLKNTSPANYSTENTQKTNDDSENGASPSQISERCPLLIHRMSSICYAKYFSLDDAGSTS